MGQAARGAEGSTKGLGLAIAILSIPLLPVLALLLRQLGSSKNMATPMSAGIVMLPNAYNAWRREQEKSHAEQALEAETGEVRTEPVSLMVLIAIVTTLLVQGLAFLLGSVAGFTIGVTAAALDESAGQLFLEVAPVLNWALLVAEVPLLFAASLPLGRYVGHRLRKPAGLLIGAVALSMGVSLVVDALFLGRVGLSFDLSSDFVGQSVLGLVVLVSLWIGYEWAQRTKRGFLIARLLQGVPDEDRLAVLDMLRERNSSAL